MSTSHQFRNIAEKHDADRSDRLFRAAVSAFCALTRPTRRDLIQLEELCLQLYDGVSADSLRYVSAALSECALAPAALVRRLAGESLEIAAPLLLKSNALREIDLIALIGRHGIGHARVIARRQHLGETISALLAKLLAAADRKAPTIADETRKALRGMMLPSVTPEENEVSEDVEEPLKSPYERLRATALGNSLPAFEAELAHTLQIDVAQASTIISTNDLADFSRTLKTLELSSEQAFLLAAATVPSAFLHRRAVHGFVSRYEAISQEDAAATLRLYQTDAAFAAAGRRSETTETERNSRVA